ncbi:MAG: MYXO-CTERM sorting domain-containing protein, partial [Myxococcota bacterium]
MGAEIELGSFTRGEPAVASNGAHYLVVWEEEADNSLPDVVGALVGLDGAVLRELEMPIAVGPEHDTAPAVASDGTDFLVTWVQGNVGEQIVRGMRVSGATGELLDGAPLPIDTGFSGIRGGIRCPAVAGHGELYRAFWFAGSFLRTGRIAPTGERLDPDPGDLWGPGVSCFAAASDGDGFVAAWSTSRVQLAPFGASITSFPPRELGGTDAVPSVPDVASDGSGYLTVWGEASELRAGRLDSAGTLLDDGGFPIAADGTARRPQVAGGPEGYLVTWGSGADVLRAVHVGGDGSFGHPFLVHPGATPATGIGTHDLARGDDGRYLAVYADPASFGTRIAARVICDGASSAPGGDGGVAADGGPGDPPPNTTCSAAPDADGGPAASFGVLALALIGMRRRRRWPGTGGAGWRRARIAATVALGAAGWTSGVAAQGEVGPASGGPPACDGPTVGPEIELASEAHGDPAVASHDRGYLVVWQVVGDDTLRDLVGVRLDAQGNLLDTTPIAIATGPGDDWNPALASDGFDYLVTWVHGSASPRSIRTARVSGKTGA